MLTEHDFLNAFKNDRSAGNGICSRKATTSKVVLASRPKISFWSYGSTSSGHYGWLLVCGVCCQTGKLRLPYALAVRFTEGRKTLFLRIMWSYVP
jgi:hypothetical protein